MSDKIAVDIQALFADGKAIDAALAEAGRNAMIMHKRLGFPAVSWENGRVVLIPPDDIVVDEPPRSNGVNGAIDGAGDTSRGHE